MPIKLKKYLCFSCKVDGVIICTASRSNTNGCDKGALTLDEAQKRKRLTNEMWQNYIKTKHTAGK